jgi:hypothetical protein
VVGPVGGAAVPDRALVPDVQTRLCRRPIYHHKRVIEAHLTVVFAALAVSWLVEKRSRRDSDPSAAVSAGPYFDGAGVAGPGGFRGSSQRAEFSGRLVSVKPWWGGVGDW